MTLEEIKKRKNIVGNVIEEKGIVYKVTIVPKREKDFQDFIKDYLDKENKLELAIACSVNQKFKLCGIWSDGVNILKINI
ncbi:hypothetical protein [Tenacibaculum aestuarii]|uniref:hypothetical protein n=1 Tax=Tenacibaculum aestuarii TaxID=362781 RepID=UPI00389681D1